MKNISFKKLGISMVALVITIIVLIILASAVVITGVGAPQQAQLAVFYSNIDTVQDLVSLEMGNNMIEGALGQYGDNYKWTGIVEGFGWDKNNNVLLEPENAFNKTSEGIGENIEPIMSDLLEKTTIAEGEKSKYYVGESGTVYYKGFEYEGKTYYSKDKKVEEINKQIEPVTVITPKNIAEHPTLYYGAVVNYMNGEQPFRNIDDTADVQWRIFYSDEENIYLTTRDIVETSGPYSIPNLENDATWINNMYADWAHEGITFGMFKNSYNAIVGPNVLNFEGTQEGGYVVVENSVSELTGLQEKLYSGITAYWLASWTRGFFQWYDRCTLYVQNCYIDNREGEHAFDYMYGENLKGIRPLVCLKSNVALVESGINDERGYMTYDLILQQ